MANALDIDLEKLKARAYDIADWAEGVLRRYHAMTPKVNGLIAQHLRTVHDCIPVPQRYGLLLAWAALGLPSVAPPHTFILA
jgi:hypothetical protein